jgi:RNA polymerase sigma factor (sigma-70 family)
MGAAARKWRKPEYRKKVEELLSEYIPLKKSLQGWELFPSCVPIYGEEGVMSSANGSSTESYGLKRAERRKKIDQIEKALSVLNEDEKEVIRKTYFEELSVVMVCEELSISPAKYRRIKAKAIDKIAIVLNLI